MESFKEGDRVITSKGRFGIITSIEGKYAHVKMGNKIHEIYQAELLPMLGSRGVEVEFYKDFINTFSIPDKEIVYIPKNIVAYDFSNPMTNNILDECKLKLIKRINYANIIIIKLKLI